MRYQIVLFFLIISFIPVNSAAGGRIQSRISVAPLWVMAEYGLYWGATVSGEVTIKNHHKIIANIDLAPLGMLDMTDVETRGKEQHWGVTLGYLFEFELIDKLLRIAPGIMAGLSSIPYLYGTLHWDYTEDDLLLKPERELIFGGGPELKLSIGRRKLKFISDGRIFFSKSNFMAVLATMGLSFDF